MLLVSAYTFLQMIIQALFESFAVRRLMVYMRLDLMHCVCDFSKKRRASVYEVAKIMLLRSSLVLKIASFG